MWYRWNQQNHNGPYKRKARRSEWRGGDMMMRVEIRVSHRSRKGLPRWLSGKESGCQCSRHKRCRYDPWVGKIPWKRKWQHTPVFLPGEFHGQRSQVGCSPWGHKELDTTEQLTLTHRHAHTHTHTHRLKNQRMAAAAKRHWESQGADSSLSLQKKPALPTS